MPINPSHPRIWGFGSTAGLDLGPFPHLHGSFGRLDGSAGSSNPQRLPRSLRLGGSRVFRKVEIP
jgi:hypothetical protein